MPRFIGPRRALSAVALSAAALVAAPSLAGAASPKPHHTSFALTPLAKFVPCMAADGVTPPTVTVDVEREKLNDKLTISGKFVGERALVERCVVTLAGERGVLVIEPPGGRPWGIEQRRLL